MTKINTEKEVILLNELKDNGASKTLKPIEIDDTVFITVISKYAHILTDFDKYDFYVEKKYTQKGDISSLLLSAKLKGTYESINIGHVNDYHFFLTSYDSIRININYIVEQIAMNEVVLTMHNVFNRFSVDVTFYLV